MKQQNKTVFTPLSEKAIKALCNETKETNIPAKDIGEFSIVDLWHIQKSMKLSSLRRNSMI